MTLSTYHSHTKFCDGKNTPEEMVLAAIKLGCHEIGFSGHGYSAGDEEWCIPNLGILEEYKKEILRQKEKYKNDIKIYLGIEYDYFCEFPTDDFDYVIGAVHTVVKDGDRLSVDGGTKEDQIAQLNKYYGGDFLAYAKDYYTLVADLYRKTKCDIIAHFDLVSKYNEMGEFFSETDEKYREIALSACDKLLATPVTFEINTGAMHRGYRTQPYPADFIIERIKNENKRVLINSDTHSDNTITFAYDFVKEKLDTLGCGYYISLEEVIKNRRCEK